MLSRLLFLQPAELPRLVPFFGLYLLLFIGLTLGDGLSLALFVQKVGAANLPKYYGLTALFNLLFVGGYLLAVGRIGSYRLFQIIVICSSSVYLAAWIGVSCFDGGNWWFGLFFVGRETSYTLVLMHFGTYLQDYFSRDQLNRVMPIVYAGGRAGGIAGGWVLETFSAPLGPLNLVWVLVGLGGVCLAILFAISCRFSPVNLPADEQSDAGLLPPKTSDVANLEDSAIASVSGFLKFVWASPLLFWTTVTTLLYVACRWILNYQYNTFFESHFADEVAMAEFLGRYTQIALLVSLVVQLFVINRLVAAIGLKGAHCLYGGLLLGGLCLNVFPMTLTTALFSRLLESELRFGLRNPVAQLIINQYSKSLRIRVRAWSLGALIPCATLATSLLLESFTAVDSRMGVAYLGCVAGFGYMAASIGICHSFSERLRWRSA